MLLAIDVGNTNTVLAVFDNDKLIAQWRMMTEARRTADEYAATILPLLGQAGLTPSDITAAIASFVVPRAIFPVRTFCQTYFEVNLLTVGDPEIKTGVRILIDNPRELGADLIVNAVAAWKRHGRAMVIVDFGTATTFSVINDNGDYLGACISPGINLSIEALHMAAAQLPTVEVAAPDKVIGKGTVSAMQSGIFYGYVGLIEGIVNRIKKEYGQPMLVIATGGLAPLFENETPVIDRVERNLTIDGLHIIYKMNS